MATVWTESIGVVDTEVIATFVDGPFPGGPAVTRRTAPGGGSETGAAWYVGTELAPEALSALLTEVCAAAGVAPVLGGASAVGLDVIVRQGSDATYTFAINHGGQDVPLDLTGTDLLTGRLWSGGSSVPAGGVAVIARPLPA